MKQLIIFDCDGTLVESEVIATRVFTKYWATHGVHFTEDEFKEKFIGSGQNAPINIETFKKMPSFVKEEGDKLLDIAIQNDLEVVSGMNNLLEELSKFKLCVGSNSSMKYVEQVLFKTGLYKYFNKHFYSAELVNEPKPAPDLFLHCARSLNVGPANCLVIEDSPAGLRAAKNAGMKAIAFTGATHFTTSLRDKLLKEDYNWHAKDIGELKEIINNAF